MTEPTRIRVLVVDDHATNRRILEEMLTSWHMQPTAVPNAEAGLRELERAAEEGEPFPLMILDAMMPQVDGYTLARRVKSHPALSATNIVMLTSGGHPGEAARCRDLGIEVYLLKPVKHSELLDGVLQAMRIDVGDDARAAVKAGEVPGRTRKLRILLVEDNPINQKLAVRCWRSRGTVHWPTTDGGAGGAGRSRWRAVGGDAAVRCGTHGRADAGDGWMEATPGSVRQEEQPAVRSSP
jgi:CheY-like chemotaxis protein